MDDKERLENIKNNLTIEQITDLLMTLGADPIVKGELIMCRTICHGGDSHKLYYYDNTKLFRCYTECSDTFDVFELIVKIQTQDGSKCSLPQALRYICNYFNIELETKNFQEEDNSLQDWKIFNRYKKINNKEKEEVKKVEIKIYDEKIIDYLPHPRILP